MTGAQEVYDYLEQRTNEDAADIYKAGTDSFGYAARFCHPLGLVCEVPYFYHPAIGDNSASNTLRREAVLNAVEGDREELNFLKEQYGKVKEILKITSLFRESLEEFLRYYEYHLSAEENWACTELRAAEKATVAEKFDNMWIQNFISCFLWERSFVFSKAK